MGRDVHLQPQLGRDGHKAVPHLRKGGREILSLPMEAIGAVEQIRHLFIAVKALSGGAGHHIAAPRVHFNDLPDLCKLARIRKRAAAEFGHDLSHGRCSLPAVRRLKVLTKIYSIRKRVSKSIPGPVSGCMTKNHPRALRSGMVHDMRTGSARCHARASYSSLRMLRMPTSQKRPSVKKAWRLTPSSTKAGFLVAPARGVVFHVDLHLQPLQAQRAEGESAASAPAPPGPGPGRGLPRRR